VGGNAHPDDYITDARCDLATGDCITYIGLPFQSWNQTHPGQEITLAYRDAEWPMITRWGTPDFYFLKDGVVRAKVFGWPPGGRKAQLVAALHEVGLM
jgi:hypothetical protein